MQRNSTLWTIGVLLLGAAEAAAQGQLDAAALTGIETIPDSPLGFRNGSIIVAPIPQSDPTLGSGLVLGAGYLFQFDEGSDTSFFGAGIMRTDNGSSAAGAAVNLSFGDGRWSLLLAYGQADVNYEIDLLSGLDFGALEINQVGDLAKVKLTYGLTDRINIGFDANWLRTTITNDRISDLVTPVYPGFGITVEEVLAGPVLSWDSVDDTIYPTSGQALSLSLLRGVGLDGFDADYWQGIVGVRAYAPLGQRGVLATKATACQVEGDAPFFNLCGIGLTDGFRGYAAGRFLDNSLVSVQAEMRYQLSGRLGASVFGGAAAVADSFNSFENDGIVTAGGIGLRYRLSRQFPLDLGVDATMNGDGEQTTYVRVGQAF